MLDLHTKVGFKQAIAPQVQTNSNVAIVGAIIDTQGFDSVEFAITLGTVAAGVSGAVTMEHGNDPALADTAAPAAGDIVGSANFVTADSNTVKKVGYLPKLNAPKRYLRITVTPAGNGAASLPIAGTAVLSDARQGPVA